MVNVLDGAPRAGAPRGRRTAQRRVCRGRRGRSHAAGGRLRVPIRPPGFLRPEGKEFSRVFIHHWSVNFKFVPNETFVSPAFAAALLACHLTLLLALAHRRWHRHGGGFFPAFIVDFFTSRIRSDSRPATPAADYAPAHVARVLFEGNFVGIVFARSLHYQFYEWYYHTLPLLLWGGSTVRVAARGIGDRISLMVAVEVCWNVIPSTPCCSSR